MVKKKRGCRQNPLHPFSSNFPLKLQEVVRRAISTRTYKVDHAPVKTFSRPLSLGQVPLNPPHLRTAIYPVFHDRTDTHRESDAGHEAPVRMAVVVESEKSELSRRPAGGIFGLPHRKPALFPVSIHGAAGKNHTRA